MAKKHHPRQQTKQTKILFLRSTSRNVRSLLRRTMSNAPDAGAGQQDFIKGWPHPTLLQRPQLQQSLVESFQKAMSEDGASMLNYGTAAEGAYMRGHPKFLSALSEYLSSEYEREVDPATLMSTGGGSMGTDLCCRVHAQAGDYAICEAPTYYLGKVSLFVVVVVVVCCVCLT